MGFMGKQAHTGAKRGRKAALGVEHVAALRAIVHEHPHSTLDEVTRALVERTGAHVCSATVRTTLRKAGIRQAKPERKPEASQVERAGKPVRYGYTEKHRRADGPSGMNTDLTDTEWALVSDLFEQVGGRGRPAKHIRKHMVDACCYVVRTGCAWRLLPKNFPPWAAVHKAFSRWAEAGVFEAMHDRLRGQWRERMGRRPEPTAGIIDAQSNRSSAQGGMTGFDAGKKVKGRKRHLVVDTLGLLLAVTVTAASVQDRDAAPTVVAQACAKVTGLQRLYADGAYAGKCKEGIEVAHPSLNVEIVRHPNNRNTGTWDDAQLPLLPEPPAKGFVVLAKRWVVERTHAWNERARRLMAHHDRSSWAPVAWVWLVEARILATRLAS
jgi:transposase